MIKRIICIAALLLMAPAPSARAADICRAIVLHDVAAVEDSHAILRRGTYDRAITQYSVNRNGIASFCSHGGYCYPTHVIEGGRKIEALRLTNCRITTRKAFENEDETAYELDVIRSAVAPIELKVDDLDNRLLGLGLCSPCAASAAWLYVHKPQSHCAQLTRKALEGNPTALAELKDSPAYCQAR